MQNPLYDQELVDLKFARDYSFNEDSFKNEDGVITDQLGYRLAKIDALQRLKNDTTKADEFFTQYKTKIELPDINSTQPTVDQEYEQFKASSAENAKFYDTVVVPALTALKPTDIPLNVSINDPNNQMQFDIGISVDQQDFEKAKANAFNLQDWILSNSRDQQGNFTPNRLQRAILIADNFDKYAQTIARQAVNAERKRVIGKETGGEGITRNYSVEIPTELQELEKYVFPKTN